MRHPGAAQRNPGSRDGNGAEAPLPEGEVGPSGPGEGRALPEKTCNPSPAALTRVDLSLWERREPRPARVPGSAMRFVRDDTFSSYSRRNASIGSSLAARRAG